MWGINVIEASYSLIYFNGPAALCALWMWNLLTVHKNISWKIKKTFSEGRPDCKWMNTNTRMLVKQTKTWKHSIKPTALQLSLSAICLLSSETQLCDHWQTLAPNTTIFPPCHQMVPLRIEAEPLFVFYLRWGRNGVANDYKTPALKIKQTETLAMAES